MYNPIAVYVFVFTASTVCIHCIDIISITVTETFRPQLAKQGTCVTPITEQIFWPALGIILWLWQLCEDDVRTIVWGRDQDGCVRMMWGQLCEDEIKMVPGDSVTEAKHSTGGVIILRLMAAGQIILMIKWWQLDGEEKEKRERTKGCLQQLQKKLIVDGSFPYFDSTTPPTPKIKILPIIIVLIWS